MNRRTSFFAFVGACVCGACFAVGDTGVVWKTDFTRTVSEDGVLLPEGWESKGTKWGVDDSVFSVQKEKDGTQILHMTSDKGRGGLFTDVEGVDLNKTPIMRWKWKAIELPKGGDGRFDDKGDQAIEIYVLSGSVLAQKCIVYTWETETPKDASKSFSVFMGVFKAKWFCVRNKEDGLGKWYTDERNVAEDFKKTYGFVPDEVGVMVFCKSDMTKTRSEAALAWVEFTAGK